MGFAGFVNDDEVSDGKAGGQNAESWLSGRQGVRPEAPANIRWKFATNSPNAAKTTVTTSNSGRGSEDQSEGTIPKRVGAADGQSALDRSGIAPTDYRRFLLKGTLIVLP